MQLRRYHPSEQIDPAVDLGAIPKPLPPILLASDLAGNAPPKPPQLVEGVLHRGCKLLLGGTSKSYKSWSLLDLALSVATGQPWWGRPCAQAPVLYLNFELHPWAITERLMAVAHARPECKESLCHLHVWNLRGYQADFTLLRPRLEAHLRERDFGLIVLDPAYKVLGGRDENSNGEIADLMNELENLCQSSGAALAVAHHFAKGDSTAKAAIDRMSGAGAWARDPDALLVLTPHEEEDCFTVTSILRNMPRLDDFVVRWDWPLMYAAPDLNPDSVRRTGGKTKIFTDREFINTFLTTTPQSWRTIVEKGSDLRMSRSTIGRYLKRLTEAGQISSGSGMYWAKDC